MKFSSRFDPKNIAELEYKYMSMAKDSGINIPLIKLVTTKNNNHYFLIKRFDRFNGRKIHMISAAALLECDYQAPSLDYNDLIKLTRVVTGSEDDVIDMYRRMVFNVMVDNQDDHAKNFSFLYNEQEKRYRLSPAYDITPGRTYYGEHTTSVNGKGKDITDNDMLKVASNNRISLDKATEIINKIKRILTINGVQK